MGVAVNQYLILGVKLAYGTVSSEQAEDYEDNGYKPDVIHKNGLATVSDGMNGKYIFIGRILEKSPNYERIDGPYCFEPVDPERAELIAGLINLSFPNLTVDSDMVRTWFVTHYH